jgi:hypothetical protein
MMRANGAPLADIATEHCVSKARVSQIVKQVAASIPEEERGQITKMRRAFLDQVKAITMEIALQPAKPSFAPNGKPHVDPKTGEPIMDNSERLAAAVAALKADERIARLTGTDNALQFTVGPSADVERATQAAAEKALSQFPTLIGIPQAG